MKKFLFFYPLFLLLTVSCSDEFAELASESEETSAKETMTTTTDNSTLFSITNEFQDHTGLSDSVYIHLTSTKTEKTYIIPPTKYKSVELDRIIIENAKVDGQCITVPAKDFPILVSICQSPECYSIRSLNVVLKKPAHYNISGIGGLLIPQVYPVSPCSENFIKLMQTVEEYTQL